MSDKTAGKWTYRDERMDMSADSQAGPPMWVPTRVLLFDGRYVTRVYWDDNEATRDPLYDRLPEMCDDLNAAESRRSTEQHPATCGGTYEGLGFVDAAQRLWRARCTNHGRRLVEGPPEGPFVYVDESGSASNPQTPKTNRELGRDALNAAEKKVFREIDRGHTPQYETGSASGPQKCPRCRRSVHEWAAETADKDCHDPFHNGTVPPPAHSEVEGLLTRAGHYSFAAIGLSQDAVDLIRDLAAALRSSLSVQPEVESGLRDIIERWRKPLIHDASLTESIRGYVEHSTLLRCADELSALLDSQRKP